MTFEKICIVGLGLIGGSLAKAIRECPNPLLHPLGSTKSLDDALSDQVIDKGTTDLYEGLQGERDLCLPLYISYLLIRDIMPILGKDTVITDVGSTKRNHEGCPEIKASNQARQSLW